MFVNPHTEGADVSRNLSRFEGRLFAEGGCLFLVVHADEAAGVARVTCRLAGQTDVVEMPLPEVARRISASPGLILDNLNGPASAKRITEGEGGWYFEAREGRMGPFGAREEAARELVRYVLSMQVAGGARREPLRPAALSRRPAEEVGAIS